MQGNLEQVAVLQLQLQQIMDKKHHVDQELEHMAPLAHGAYCLNYYRLKKIRSDLNDEALKINSHLYPDIIA